VLDAFPRVGSVGLLYADATTDGRLLFEAGGRPVIRYSFSRQDRDRLHSGLVHAIDMLVAAGARRLWPSLWSTPVLELADVERFRRTPPPASDYGLVSYHPLGTCRMGKDPRRSVVGLDHQVHDLRALYVVDGSTVRGPLGVNPQITIMAMATRAAGIIAGNLG
jgi:choline dehydrogenase-like flavoprotein